jgi:hypothetical protein
MLNFSTTDLDIFLGKAEHKLVELGEKLIVQVTYDTVENCLLDKILLLSEIIDAVEDSNSQEEIDKLVYFALDYYDLYTLPYSPFSIMSTTILSSSGNTGGSGGIVFWSEILDKPDTFVPSPHTHKDEEILLEFSGITETVGGITPGSFTGTLEEFLTKMLIKYQPPSFASFTQNKGASFKLGQAITGDVTFSWTINNSATVKDSSNSGSITMSELTIFTSNSAFNLYSTSGVVRSLIGSTYTKIDPGSITFYLNGIASDDSSMNAASTSITWYSQIHYGNSTSGTITSTDIEGFQFLSTNERQSTFTINGSGYKYVFIPDNISVSGIKFVDPNSGFEIAMNAYTTATISNGFIDLPGKLYRTKNSLGSALTVNIQ